MLEFKNVYKSYDNEVIKNLSFILKNGEKLAIVGDSGIGKTTIFNLILKFETPDKGEVVNNFKRISTVFQENRLIEEISALENLNLVSEKPETELKAILSELGIENENQRVSLMSGGMKRRVAIARALAYGGDLYLLDEPIQGLDVETRDRVIEAIKKYTKGSSTILISHEDRDLVSFGIEDTLLVL